MILPSDYLERMKELLEEEYEEFLESYSHEEYRAIRLNPHKSSREEVLDRFVNGGGDLSKDFHLKPVPWEEYGFYYDNKDRPGISPYHEAGVYYIQEPSAMLPANLLDLNEEGLRVLDLCAAPGGKTTQIASKMGGKGLLVANEINPVRAAVLSENVERLGIKNCVVINEDPLKLKERFGGFFDRILVDAPCSGEGMFRKNEAAPDEWSVENVEMCAKRQRMILEAASEMLIPGGKLVYSTCTFEKEENEAVVEGFVRAFDEFTLISEERIYPHRAKGEGHFAALLEKRSEVIIKREAGRNKRKRKAAISGTDLSELSVFLEEELNSFEDALGVSMQEMKEEKLIQFGRRIFLLPDEMPEIAGLKVLRPGLCLGEPLKGRFMPSHSLALYLKPWDVRKAVKLKLYGNNEEKDGSSYMDGSLYSYIEGASIPYTGEKGYCLICADDYSLSWGKAGGGRINNLYPKGLRKKLR